MSDRGRVLLIGGLSGALIGLAGAWLYLRSARSHSHSAMALPGPTELVKLGFSIVGILRQIAALGRAGTA
jgi:hypothetical protein